jgi:hypothetical protein
MRWRGGRLQTGLLASISAADRQQGRSFTNAQTCSGRRKKNTMHRLHRAIIKAPASSPSLLGRTMIKKTSTPTVAHRFGSQKNEPGVAAVDPAVELWASLQYAGKTTT